MRWPFLARRAEPGEAHPTSALVSRLLVEAIASRTTDLHFVPAERGGGRLRLRCDGFFRDGEVLDAALFPRVIARLKVLAGLSVFRTGEPQDGRIDFETPEGRCDLRLSVLPVLGGEKAVVRVFGPSDRPRRLADLGLGETERRDLLSLLDLPPGLLVVTGPCSSGKTTTLYALVRELLDREGDHVNVVSAEDPIEQVVEGMAQTEVDPARELSFARVLSSQLRQDPEVLLVAETRDPETARLVMEAAFTGHRVLTSLHVGRPAEVPRRLELLGVPSYLVREALRAVVNQRLVRRTCGCCRGAGAGCPDCGGSGHFGRRAVAELVRFEDGEPRWLGCSLEDAARSVEREGATSPAELARVFGLRGAS